MDDGLCTRRKIKSRCRGISRPVSRTPNQATIWPEWPLSSSCLYCFIRSSIMTKTHASRDVRMRCGKYWPSSAKAECRLYHYTDLSHLRGILRTGAILPCCYLAGSDPQGLPPVVWVSSADPWEVISAATLLIGPEGGVGLPRDIVPGNKFQAARINVAPAITKPWQTYLQNQGVDISVIARLWQTGTDYRSDPRKWQVCRGDVTADNWRAIELWDDERWLRIPASGKYYTAKDLDTFLSD